MPPGDFSNQFDFPAINMAAAHNMFIQGVNAMATHAPYVTDKKVQPFMLFCLTVLGNIHHHHRIEETFYFEALEKKLGEGYLTESKDEHETFVPQIEATESWLEDVRDGKTKYLGSTLLAQINSWADDMVHHLNHEIEKLDRNKIKECFTEKELKAIDSEFMKVALKDANFYTSLPMVLICGNPATPWRVFLSFSNGNMNLSNGCVYLRFPPFPLPLIWAIRYWYSRRHREAWEFGPLDLNGKVKPLPSSPK
ncbi:hypothetical protein CPB83DRAFT_907629 [Crepidotus variabilis]|uniref:Hemerythrin-like domain-containing protein n=1 Tax=Crepidotus variabilis TaxID=179855 RepID=A0A9P6EE58_9AGAR|nr:hypothetical protein CPB83DRAFT_907629 [Crepidotus variabilis]